jgi:predicted MFS family arabinose efflux permease
MAEEPGPVGEDETEGHAVMRPRGTVARLRGLAIDVTPLRASRDFRLLWTGELVSMFGRQITVVALPLQVYLLTHSPLAVGFIGLVQLVPLVVFSLIGGVVADRVDRRKLILVTEIGLAGATSLLLLGAVHGHPPLWFLYSATALASGIGAMNSPARTAAVPNLVGREHLPAAVALNQVLFNASGIVGPAVGGVLLSRFGLEWAYAADVISSAAAVAASLLLRPLPPEREEGVAKPSGWSGIWEGLAYLKGRRLLQSTFLIDLDAMIFGMPRALFPILALTEFHVGASGLGLLYAAPGVGALTGALTAGWVGRIRRQGLAVIWAVVVWGIAITLFGLSGGLFWAALAFLAAAGAADVISAVFRSTILQLAVPDALRGRLSSVHLLVVTGGPRLGDLEAGVVASLVSPWFSVVSGGVACVAGALLMAVAVPELARYRSPDATTAR